MKGKHLVLLLLIVAAIGGACYYFHIGFGDSWSASGGGSAGAKVLNIPINDISQIRVKASDGEVNLVKKDDIWTVQERANYSANFEQISGLLRKLWDLKTVQEVEVGPSQYARLDLVEPGKGAGSGTLLEFKDKDGKSLGALLLGKKYMKKGNDSFDMGGFPAGRYILPLTGAPHVSLVSESLEEVNVKPENWLKRDFIKVENVKSITLAGTTDPQHWKIVRENVTADWKMDAAKEDEKLDSIKVSPVANAFANLNFVDVLAPDAKPAETGLDQAATVTIETFDNFTYSIKIGKLTGDNYPMMVEVSAIIAKERTAGKDEKPEDKTKLDEEFKKSAAKLEEKLAAEKKYGDRPHLVPKYSVEQVLKDRSALLVEKKPEPAAPANPAPASPVPATPAPGTGAAPAANPPVTVTTPPVAAPPITPPAAPAPEQKPPADAPPTGTNPPPPPAPPAPPVEE